jgi:c-di-AMP phosphodiesterase-like protein
MEIDLTTIQSVAPWVLVGIAVVAVVLAIVIKKIVGKIIVLVLAAILIFVGWQQRQHAIDFANEVRSGVCDQSVTFVGIAVAMPAGWCTPG